MSDRTINGIRLQVVADLATGKNIQPPLRAVGIGDNDDLRGYPFQDLTVITPTSVEKLIAHKARNYLDRLRRKGFAKEQCRLGFWRKIEQLASASASPPASSSPA